MDADQQKSAAAAVPVGTGMAGPETDSHADGGDQAWPGTPVVGPASSHAAADVPADQFDSAGRADFLRRTAAGWGSASYADRQTARELLYDSGYDIGVPKVADRDGNLVRHPHLPLINGESNAAQDPATLQAIGQYLDNEKQRPGINADRYTAIHDPEKILNDPNRPWFDMGTERMLATLDPRVQALARLHFEAMHDAGLNPRVPADTGGFRSYEKQDELYAQGRGEDKGKHPVVTKAKGGESNHNFGLAYDVAPLDAHGHAIESGSDPAYAAAARLGQQAGLEWGGSWKRFRDPAHYQFMRGAPMADRRARHDQHLDPLPQTD